MLLKFTNETKSAEVKRRMRNITAKFLSPEEENGQRSRQKRAAPVAAASAVAGIALFGSLGVSMASSEGCGITGLFGKCQIMEAKIQITLHDLTNTHQFLLIMYSKLSQRAKKNSFLSQKKLLKFRKSNRKCKIIKIKTGK